MRKKFFQNLFKSLIQHIFKIKYGHISILRDDNNLNIISSNVSQIKISDAQAVTTRD